MDVLGQAHAGWVSGGWACRELLFEALVQITEGFLLLYAHVSPKLPSPDLQLLLGGKCHLRRRAHLELQMEWHASLRSEHKGKPCTRERAGIGQHEAAESNERI